MDLFIDYKTRKQLWASKWGYQYDYDTDILRGIDTNPMTMSSMLEFNEIEQDYKIGRNRNTVEKLRQINEENKKKQINNTVDQPVQPPGKTENDPNVSTFTKEQQKQYDDFKKKQEEENKQLTDQNNLNNWVLIDWFDMRYELMPIEERTRQKILYQPKIGQPPSNTPRKPTFDEYKAGQKPFNPPRLPEDKPKTQPVTEPEKKVEEEEKITPRVPRTIKEYDEMLIRREQSFVEKYAGMIMAISALFIAYSLYNIYNNNGGNRPFLNFDNKTEGKLGIGTDGSAADLGDIKTSSNGYNLGGSASGLLAKGVKATGKVLKEGVKAGAKVSKAILGKTLSGISKINQNLSAVNVDAGLRFNKLIDDVLRGGEAYDTYKNRTIPKLLEKIFTKTEKPAEQQEILIKNLVEEGGYTIEGLQAMETAIDKLINDEENDQAIEKLTKLKDNVHLELTKLKINKIGLDIEEELKGEPVNNQNKEILKNILLKSLKGLTFLLISTMREGKKLIEYLAPEMADSFEDIRSEVIVLIDLALRPIKTSIQEFFNLMDNLTKNENEQIVYNFIKNTLSTVGNTTISVADALKSVILNIRNKYNESKYDNLLQQKHADNPTIGQNITLMDVPSTVTIPQKNDETQNLLTTDDDENEDKGKSTDIELKNIEIQKPNTEEIEFGENITPIASPKKEKEQQFATITYTPKSDDKLKKELNDLQSKFTINEIKNNFNEYLLTTQDLKTQILYAKKLLEVETGIINNNEISSYFSQLNNNNKNLFIIEASEKSDILQLLHLVKKFYSDEHFNKIMREINDIINESNEHYKQQMEIIIRSDKLMVDKLTEIKVLKQEQDDIQKETEQVKLLEGGKTTTSTVTEPAKFNPVPINTPVVIPKGPPQATQGVATAVVNREKILEAVLKRFFIESSISGGTVKSENKTIDSFIEKSLKTNKADITTIAKENIDTFKDVDLDNYKLNDNILTMKILINLSGGSGAHKSPKMEPIPNQEITINIVLSDDPNNNNIKYIQDAIKQYTELNRKNTEIFKEKNKNTNKEYKINTDEFSKIFLPYYINQTKKPINLSYLADNKLKGVDSGNMAKFISDMTDWKNFYNLIEIVKTGDIHNLEYLQKTKKK